MQLGCECPCTKQDVRFETSKGLVRGSEYCCEWSEWSESLAEKQGACKTRDGGESIRVES